MKTSQLTRATLAFTAIALSLLMVSSSSVMAATNGQGIHYQYNPGSKQVTLTTPTLDVRVSTDGNVPHFMFWDPRFTDPATRINYHVQFIQLIEFNDTDDDGTFTAETDHVIDPILGLGRVDWDFSGFLTEEDEGITTAVHFNFTLNYVQGTGFETLYMELRCHINATNNNELKFDVVISGWPWASSDTLLALRWDLMVTMPGMHQYQHAYSHRYENRNYSFDGAFFAYKHSANAGNETVDVTCNYEDHPEHTRFYLVYPNFGDELFVHDPVIGLDGSVVPPNALLPILIVIGAGALACLVIAASLWTRRRNAAPNSPS